MIESGSKKLRPTAWSKPARANEERAPPWVAGKKSEPSPNGAQQRFTIFFDFNLCTLPQDPPPFVNADFNLLTIQPDLALHSNGFYDALALRSNPSFADPFKLRFVRLGTSGTTPGAQPCAIYNADFSTQSQGQTTNVPEPSALTLLLAAIATLDSRRRKRTPSPLVPKLRLGTHLSPQLRCPPRRRETQLHAQVRYQVKFGCDGQKPDSPHETTR